MRYPDGGGLTAAGRPRREQVRLSAAAMFEQDMKPVQVAYQLRVSTKSLSLTTGSVGVGVNWRTRWRIAAQPRGYPRRRDRPVHYLRLV